MRLRWRLGAVYRWNFYTGAFLTENFSPFLGSIFDFGGIFQGLGTPLRETASFEPSCAKIRRPVWPVGRSTKKVYYIREKFSLYFTHLPRSPQWTDLHEILHGGSSRWHNHLFQILCRSVEGFRICVGSNFTILPLLSRSPLTQGCATTRLWPVNISVEENT